MYSIDREVPLDFVLAHKWLSLAALQGKREAQARRRELAAAMSEGQIAEAQRLAREWKLRH